MKDCGEKARTFVFERGDVVDLEFNHEVHNNSFVEKGTHLLSFNSMMHNLDVQRVDNERTIEQSKYTANATPDKNPDLEQAKEELLLAESNQKLQEANHNRFTALYADEVISKFELDQQINRLEVANQGIKVAEQKLRSVQFGAKKEDLAVRSTTISSIDNELKILQGRNDSYNVYAPFNGLVTMSPEPGIVVQVLDTTTRVLVFPIDDLEMAYFNSNATLYFADDDETEYRDFEIESKVHVLNGRQIRLASMVIEEKNLDIGLFTSCVIQCDTIRLREYLKRKFF